MKLEWIGHACFRMTAADGTVVITDPYDQSVGIRMLPLHADLITMSHAHHDHSETCMIEGSPVILRDTESGSVGSVKTSAYMGYHDPMRGLLRGKNAVRIFEIDGLKVVHMGDIGCMPSEEILDAISGADVMMIPTGGFFTVDAKEAKAIIDRTKPKRYIPMHIKTASCGYPIAGVHAFLKVLGKEDAKALTKMELMPGSVGEGLLMMKPEADEL